MYPSLLSSSLTQRSSHPVSLHPACSLLLSMTLMTASTLDSDSNSDNDLIEAGDKSHLLIGDEYALFLRCRCSA
jgi:hypothetical protein